jgi:hypothetical protein
LRIVTGTAVLTLPERKSQPADALLAPFPPPEIAPPLARTELRQGRMTRMATQDHATGTSCFETLDDTGLHRIDATGLAFATRRLHSFRIQPGKPLSAHAETLWETETGRDAWQTRTVTRVAMTATETDFHIEASLDAFEGETSVCHRDWDETIPRDLV